MALEPDSQKSFPEQGGGERPAAAQTPTGKFAPLEQLDVPERQSWYIELGGNPLTFHHAPKKLGIPVDCGEQFEAIVEQLTHRIEYLGISNPKLPPSALVLALEANQGVITTGYMGAQRNMFVAALNDRFGEGKWSFQHLIQGRLLDREFALRLYEEAYRHYFSRGEGVKFLPDIIEKYSDVYDNARSNVQSGMDYNAQECPERGHHVHDIAIRRALASLGYPFVGVEEGEKRGLELLEVRSKRSAGWELSPGLVPFHRPALIPKIEYSGRQWWEPGTIEDFYQKTRRLVVDQFTDDTLLPQNPQTAQTGPAYYQRVAARSVLRMLPILEDQTVDLGTLNELPWMVDHNSFPLGDNGLPRQFERREICDILRAAGEQFEVLYRPYGKTDHLLNEWAGFTRMNEFFKALETWAEKGADHLTTQQLENFPGLGEIEQWGQVLPCFADHIDKSGRRPVFLARDGLAVMEYMAYRRDLDGQERESVKRSVYLPGNPDRNLPKNQRAEYPPLERMVERLFEVVRCAYEEQGLTKPPKNEQEAAALQQSFVTQVRGIFEELRNARDEEGAAEYHLWFDIYSQIRGVFDGDLSDAIVVDTDGTGKSVLFIKTMLEYFSEARGEPVTIDMVVGGLQKYHLGIPRLDELYDLNKFSDFANVLPDIRWPFRFQKFDPDPCFNVRLAPVMQLQLFWRSLNFYNFAVRDFEKLQGLGPGE